MTRKKLSEIINEAAVLAAENSDTVFSVEIGGATVDVEIDYVFGEHDVMVVHQDFCHNSPRLEAYIADNLPDLTAVRDNFIREGEMLAQADEAMYRRLEGQFWR